MEPIEKIRKIKEAITSKYFFVDNFADEIIIKGKKQGFNPAVMLTIAADMVGGRVLYKGDYGFGKTTLPKIYTALARGIPMEVVQLATFQGHPEVSKFDLLGLPDLGKLNEGKERIIWSFAHLFDMPVIFDEFARIPEGKQGIVLSCIEEGVSKIGNNILFANGRPLYATANFIDDGNSDIIPPILDRFDFLMFNEYEGVLQTIKAQGAVQEKRVRNDLYLDQTDCLSILVDIVKESVDSDRFVESQKKIPKKILQDYAKHLNKLGLPEPLTLEERATLKEQIAEIPFVKGPENPEYFLHCLIAEINSSRKYGVKRSEDPPIIEEGGKDELRDKGTVSKHVQYPISPRIWRITDFAKAIALYAGEKKVTMGIIKAILPYALALCTFTDDFRGAVESNHRDYAIQIACAKKLVGEVQHKYDQTGYGAEVRDAIKFSMLFDSKKNLKEKEALFAKALDTLNLVKGKDDSFDIETIENPTVYDVMKRMEKDLDRKGEYL